MLSDLDIRSQVPNHRSVGSTADSMCEPTRAKSQSTLLRLEALSIRRMAYRDAANIMLSNAYSVLLEVLGLALNAQWTIPRGYKYVN
eukprot:6242670-Pyramimonas_sp.AAC.2